MGIGGALTFNLQQGVSTSHPVLTPRPSPTVCDPAPRCTVLHPLPPAHRLPREGPPDSPSPLSRPLRCLRRRCPV